MCLWGEYLQKRVAEIGCRDKTNHDAKLIDVAYASLHQNTK